MYKCDKTECSNYRSISFESTVYKILPTILLSRLTPFAGKLLGIISVGFDATGHLLITYRVSQEECARLQEGVPYVKVY